MIVIEKILTAEEVSLFRQQLADAPWLDGKQTAMGMAASVKNNHQADANDDVVRQLANRLLAKFGSTPKVVSAALPHKIFPPCFNRYGISEEYGFHVDAAVMRIPGTNEVLRSDMSMTTFLSEPDEYDGGELIIATEFGEQQIKLPAGYAVLYPSSSLHKVTAVTRGERVAAITWMQSMVADGSLRQNLYQLDQTIQTLISQGNTDRSELDNLHNVYHNLIRQFTQL
ncbi:Fe2+-dependent dioxygenase [Shewanella sp. 10N.286.52.C2]|uniref:Fe2+-dependent dioxygenase n=1 Tax=unclassified Shewanella TaxID=196818 RepID=UPI000C82D8ED|nr:MULTISPECIES: Fe2+-dependent dioxygenase [unclassified Shewanella]MDO6620975.1 Fe2+-dependent dioxygenase [Shewanella sp. 6_MG-2023]PMG31326.1 Fe2+-dependent dioxygenase [Shewanella sp. 10N.286.52.C2]